MRIVVAVAVLVLAAGCSSSKSSKPPAGASGLPVAVATSPTLVPPPSTAAAKLKIGATATLTTASGPLEVTLVKIVDPAKPAQSYIHPEQGQHWLGVQFRFVNKGTAAFVDSPLYGMDAADAEGQSRNSYPDQQIAAGPMIDPVAGIRLQPGDTRLGYLVYSVPDGVKLARLQFTPPGGSTAEWMLG